MTTKEQAIEFLQRKISKDPYSADIYRMAIEALTEKWISVSEKLPDPEDMKNIGVLVCKKSWITGRPNVIQVARWNGSKWVSNWKEIDMVTHWMPLPELPKERNVENDN